MVVGMATGLHARACCASCCCSSIPSTSSSPSSSFPLKSSTLPSSSLASSSVSFVFAAPNALHSSLRLSGSCSWRLISSSASSASRCSRVDTRNWWRKKCDRSAAPLRAAASPVSGNQESPRSVLQEQQLKVATSSSLVDRISELGEGQEESIDEDVDPASITEWELDFCSRPILDARGKKIWELIVCDGQRQLRFARFYPNNVINSGTLRDALVYIIKTLDLPKPQKIRFFRSQMQTIIGKACAELDIQAVPSQRCIQLVQWLGERLETVYSRHPGYQEGSGPLLLLEQPLPVDVPDSLRGEQWAFVQLPLSAVLEEIAAVENGENFGSVLDLDALNLDLPDDAMIPGVAVSSTRATPLAAWTNALELSSIDIEMQRACLILSSGVSDRWRYAYWRKSEQGNQEAKAWENAKSQVGGLHFLAVQSSLESELCAGFWLLMNATKSPV